MRCGGVLWAPSLWVECGSGSLVCTACLSGVTVFALPRRVVATEPCGSKAARDRWPHRGVQNQRGVGRLDGDSAGVRSNVLTPSAKISHAHALHLQRERANARECVRGV